MKFHTRELQMVLLFLCMVREKQHPLIKMITFHIGRGDINFPCCHCCGQQGMVVQCSLGAKAGE